MTRPARYSRYPLMLTILMASLAALGFLLALIGSRPVLVIFAGFYLAFFVAWWCLARSLEPKK